LIADDDEDMRVLARAVLISGGIDVVAEARNGMDALEAITRLGPPPVPTVVVLQTVGRGVFAEYSHRAPDTVDATATRNHS